MNNYHPRKQSPVASLRAQPWVHCCSYYAGWRGQPASKIRGRISFVFLGVKNCYVFLTFPVTRTRPEKIVWFLLAATSNHVQVRFTGLLYFAKWYIALFAKRNETEMKSELCEMKICTLQNGNLYLAKWKSVLCEMEICTLWNGNLYFAKWNSVLCERKLLLSNFMKNFCKEASANVVFTYNHDRDTRFSFCRGIERRVLGVLKTWDRRQKQNNFSHLVCCE